MYAKLSLHTIPVFHPPFLHAQSTSHGTTVVVPALASPPPSLVKSSQVKSSEVKSSEVKSSQVKSTYSFHITPSDPHAYIPPPPITLNHSLSNGSSPQPTHPTLHAPC